MAFYDHKPSTFEAVGNGSWLYRYNIQEVPAPSQEDEQGQRTQWQCDEVTVWPPIDANKITAAVISDRWDSNYEQKLINEYNAAKLGIYDTYTADAKLATYKAFLQERADLKATVDEDYAKYQIQ
jgi:hypothetical protein